MLGKSSLLSVPSLTPFFFKIKDFQVVLMDEAALMQLDLPPSYPGVRFGPLFAQDLLSRCFLERKSHQCHQGKLLLATPLILVDLQQIHSTMNEPLILSASKKPSTCWHQWDRAEEWPTPKGPHGMRAQPLYGSTGTSTPSKHWRPRPEERDRLLDAITVDPSPSSPMTPLVHSHVPHSVQSRVVQAKQNNLTSETRIP